MTYLDTSALIKRFVEEPGSPAVDDLVRARAPIASATIAYAEAYSGLARRHREGDLPAAGFARACEQFERDWIGYVKVHLNDDVLGTARHVIQRHALRGFDGIHLASALTLQHGWDDPVLVVGADQRLLRAAAAEGLATLNVETGETTGAPPRG